MENLSLHFSLTLTSRQMERCCGILAFLRTRRNLEPQGPGMQLEYSLSLLLQ